MFSKNQQLTSGSEHIGKPPILAAKKNLLLFSQPSQKKLPNPASNSLNNSHSRVSSFLFIGRWFRFGVVLFLLLSMMLGTAGCTASATTILWTPATRLIPVETVQGIVAENSDLNPQNSALNVLAWAVNGQAGRLVIFNFNSPGVCGAGGCLYAGYLFRKNVPPNRVFASYLNENLPPNKPLLQVVTDPSKTSDLPCLQVQQPSQNGIRQLFYCFNGRQYQLANSSLIELPNKMK
ncbi:MULTISPECIES: hypothetical protein [unclassified Microcoleus]|uniref:hypothetical protein n=1 Tax=unclassified Microcoleus TaxID=2642155 RepID=UPI002FCEBAE5